MATQANPISGEMPMKTSAVLGKSKLAVLLMPYFGSWPEWIHIYLETCRRNSRFDFFFFTDCGLPSSSIPKNVHLEQMTFREFNSIYCAQFPRHRPASEPYKLCDLRPAYGRMFRHIITRYPFFGWGDIDVVYGNLSKHLAPLMSNSDVVTCHSQHLSGHLTLVRTNLAEVLPDHFPRWYEMVNDAEPCALDEPETLKGLHVSAQETFNTPLSPKKPWTSGNFVFPSEWYWRDGRLTNDLDGDREFSHLHFMHWKGGHWPRSCGNAQWEKLTKIINIAPEDVRLGFKVNKYGFFNLAD